MIFESAAHSVGLAGLGECAGTAPVGLSKGSKGGQTAPECEACGRPEIWPDSA